ncbi:MAG: peptidyl-alpha-hydroxyglycine alpha-amidating lyase family protein [Planctomycetota bacterium]
MSTWKNSIFFLMIASVPAVVFLLGCESETSDKAKEAYMYEPVAVWDAESTRMELDKILGIGIDSKGRVYATAGKGDKGVLVFDAHGKIVDSWGQGLISKHGLRVIDDKVWVTDRERHIVMQFTLDGKLLMTLGTESMSGLGHNEFNMPSDIAIGPDGDIYVSDGYTNSRVMRFSAEGKFKHSWGTKGEGPGQFNLVHNIAIDKKGRVYIADRENERVQIFDADGNFLDQWNHVGKAFGLYIDDQMRVYITDGQSNNVYITDDKGKVLSIFGKTGDGAGEFNMAHSITVDKKGNIYVAEGDGMRIQVFSHKE